MTADPCTRQFYGNAHTTNVAFLGTYPKTSGHKPIDSVILLRNSEHQAVIRRFLRTRITSV